RERLEFAVEHSRGRLVEGRGVGAREEDSIARGHEVPQRVHEAHDARRLQVVRQVFNPLEQHDGFGLRRYELAYEPLEQLWIRRRNAVLAHDRREPEDRSGRQVVVIADFGRRPPSNHEAQRPESDGLPDGEEREPRPALANRARLPRAQACSTTTPMPPYSSSRVVTCVVTPIATIRSETWRKRFTRRRRMSSKPRKYWPMNDAVKPTASMWKK